MNKGSWGKIRAFFDLETEEGFTMKGFKLILGINGLFVGFPSEKKKDDDEYKDTVWAEPNLKLKVTDMAMKVYESDIIPDTIPQDIIESSPPNHEPFADEDIPF